MANVASCHSFTTIKCTQPARVETATSRGVLPHSATILINSGATAQVRLITDRKNSSTKPEHRAQRSSLALLLKPYILIHMKDARTLDGYRRTTTSQARES